MAVDFRPEKNEDKNSEFRMVNKTYQLHNLKNGFTLIEAVVSILILAVIIVASVAALIANLTITSYSKHRLQAVFIARQTLEDMRKHNYGNLTQSSNYSYVINGRTYGTGPVCIDVTDYNNGICGFWGDQTVAVNNVTGDTHRKMVQVQVSWSENIGGVVRAMQEYCTTDIADTAAPN